MYARGRAPRPRSVESARAEEEAAGHGVTQRKK